MDKSKGTNNNMNNELYEIGMIKNQNNEKKKTNMQMSMIM